jgi:hypothetical protein
VSFAAVRESGFGTSPTSVGAGEAAMIRILHDFLVFSCLAALVTGIVFAAASLLI